VQQFFCTDRAKVKEYSPQCAAPPTLSSARKRASTPATTPKYREAAQVDLAPQSVTLTNHGLDVTEVGFQGPAVPSLICAPPHVPWRVKLRARILE